MPHMIPLHAPAVSQQSPPKEQEWDLLKRQTRVLQRQINAILDRIDELNKKQQNVRERRSSAKASLMTDKCTACGICADACEQGAITVDDVARINGEKCTGCGSCVNMCPNGALFLR
jgi:ferredoxin